MQTLIASERECAIFIKRTMEELKKFYCSHDSPYFHVACKNGDTKRRIETPNAATSITIRIIQENDMLANELVNKSDWSKVKDMAIRSMEKISDNQEFSEVLPLKTLGILPLFSTCYLAEAFGNDAEVVDNGKRQLKIKAYALAMRKIFSCIHKEVFKKNYGGAESDALHPFLLYRCTKAINKFKFLMQRAYKNGYRDEIKEFWDNFEDRDLLNRALKKRKAIPITHEKESFYDRNEWRGFNVDFVKELKDDPLFHEHLPFKKLIDFLEERASHDALTQIARKFRQSGPEMDASALAFSLGVLADIDRQAHSHLISQGLQMALEACDNGQWHTVMPFQLDDKGRAIFVPSIEVANILLTIYLDILQAKPKQGVPDIGIILSSTEQVQRRLCEHFNSIEVFENEPKTSIKLQGWCTDKAPSYNRIDSWITAHVLAFFLRRLALIKLAKKDLILKKYSWTPFEECRPRWDEIVDPDKGLVAEGEGIKNQIEGAVFEDVSRREKSPIFLLYGPPGTAKTTIVQGIANKMEWDLVTLSPSDFIAKGIDKIEEYSRDIFNNLMNLDKCVILMDEMDSLFRDREILKSQSSPLEYVVPAFLPKLQRLRDYVMERHMAVFIVTNYYETIDSAISRGGRIDYHFLVLPYGRDAKIELISKFLGGNWLENGSLTSVARDIIEKIFDRCPPILIYREIEHIGKLLTKKWPNPSDVKVEEIDIVASINPEIYKPKSREGAYRELCALLDRINNNKRKDYSLCSSDDAIDFLRKTDITIKNRHASEWMKLKDAWYDQLNLAK